MSTSTPTLAPGYLSEEDYTSETRQQILDQLHRIVASSHFRNSKRYPALLTYIVEEAIAGNADFLKERTLGICVFDRQADYDTNADPVVRISAGEVRKRLAQYYLSAGRERELRIDVPLGSYLPHFYWPEESLHSPSAVTSVADEREEVSPKSAEITGAPPPLSDLRIQSHGTSPGMRSRSPQASASKNLLACLLLIVLLAGGLLWSSLRQTNLAPGVALFWGPSLRSKMPTLIVLGVHSFDEHGNDLSPNSHISRPQPEQTLLTAMTQTDMVHLSDVISYGALINVLSTHGHAFHTQGAADTTIEQLRAGPFLLIGGFNNIWTKRLSQQLRFRFVTLSNGTNVIQDSLHPESTWTVDTSASAISNSIDYGTVSRFLDRETDQYVLMAAGIGKSGTEAASDFLSNDVALKGWLRTLPAHSGSNVQVVISTEVIEGKHGPPRVIGYHFW